MPQPPASSRPAELRELLRPQAVRLICWQPAEQSLHHPEQLIELEVAAVLGADRRHERTEERLAYRNGYRPCSLATQVGDLELLIPKLRSGSFLAMIHEPRRRVDQAL